jgi:hypothetical protein
MERRNPKKKTGSEGHDGNSADRGVWKGLFKKLNKDRALRKALSDMGILEEEDGEVGAAETLHRILDAIKAGSLSSSAWRAAPDDESCSSSEDEDEEGREFANVGDPTQQYEYNARSVTKTVQFTPVDDEAEFDPNEPLAWSERNGMGRILVTPLPQFFKEYFETKPLHERVAGGDGAEAEILLSAQRGCHLLAHGGERVEVRAGRGRDDCWRRRCAADAEWRRPRRRGAGQVPVSHGRVLCAPSAPPAVQ